MGRKGHQHRLASGEAETFDDELPEPSFHNVVSQVFRISKRVTPSRRSCEVTHSSKTAARDALQEEIGAQHPELGIKQGLSDLVKLVLAVFDSGVVCEDLRDGRRPVRQCAAPLADEEGLLTLKTQIFLWHSEKNQAVMGDVSIAKDKRTAQPIVSGPKMRKMICRW